MTLSPHMRRSLVALAALAVCLPVVLWGSIRSMQRVENAPAFWLPASFEQRRLFDQFVRDFHCLDTLLVSWPDCTVDDARLERFGQLLLSDRRAPSGEAYRDLFAEVLTGYTALRQLMDEPLNLSRRQASARLQGSLVGPDGRSSCAVVALRKAGGRNRQMTIDIILAAAAQASGLPPEEIHLAGSVVDGAAIDAESVRSMSRYALPSALLSLLLCWWCLRSWLLTLPVLAVAAFGEGVVLALVYFSGVTMNAVLAVMAPLVFVLAISAGVHLSNYYYDQARNFGPVGAASRALRAGWLPCTVAAATTAIGMASLLVSRIIPVRQFGVFSALGVLITTGLLFLLAPGAMDCKSLRWGKRAGAGGQIPPSAADVVKTVWNRVSATVCRYWWVVILCIGLVMAWTAWGLGRVTTSVSVRNLLVGQSRIIRDYQWFEKNIGPLVPVEVLLQIDDRCPLDPLQRVELLWWIHERLAQVPGVGGITSAATFLPSIPPPGGMRQTARRAVIRRLLKSQHDQLIAAHWLARSPGREQWRISMRIPAMTDEDYGLFLGQIRQQVGQALDQLDVDGIRPVYTGLTPLVYKAQRALLRGMFLSFLTALIFVALVMILVQRSVVVGLLAMVPNVFPAILVFGFMGWSGIKVDIGSVMTASVALGIAVDGTIHFLTWYRRELAAGNQPAEAVRRAYHHCAWAMVETTVICGLGLLLFAASAFVPTRRFAWMMFALLLAALAGDLVLLPAILVSPAGKAALRKAGKR